MKFEELMVDDVCLILNCDSFLMNFGLLMLFAGKFVVCVLLMCVWMCFDVFLFLCLCGRCLCFCIELCCCVDFMRIVWCVVVLVLLCVFVFGMLCLCVWTGFLLLRCVLFFSCSCVWM